MAGSGLTTAALLLTVGVFPLLLQHQTSYCVSAAELMASNQVEVANAHADGANRPANSRRRSSLPLILSQRFPLTNSQIIRARLTPLEPLVGDLLIDDTDELLDINKRQSDDYGHMRFGKRGEVDDKFDDYGHMRFGRDHI